MAKEESRLTIETYFEKHATLLLVLSVFLIITFELANNDLPLSNLLALLAAGVSYLSLVGITQADKQEIGVGVGIILALLLLFVIVFCV